MNEKYTFIYFFNPCSDFLTALIAGLETRAYRINYLPVDKYHVDTNNWLERFMRTLKSHPEYCDRKKGYREWMRFLLTIFTAHNRRYQY